MEVRKITVVSGNMSKKVIDSSATTLGELKADLRQNGIDFAEKSFFEGLTKVELKDDNSILPKDIMRNGQVTNNLVIMLSTSNKKIKSGAMSRAEAYAKIRVLNLQDVVSKRFGRNFTMCKTVDLIEVIQEAESTSTTATKGCDCEEAVKEVITSTDAALRASFSRLVKHLYGEDIIETNSDLEYILKPLNSVEDEGDIEEGGYSHDEINNMFEFLND